MTTIITKNGSGAPTAGQLSEGELAVDLTNKELYTKSGSTVIKIGGTGGGETGTFTDLTATSSFTSPGIDDNANATAITIDASENVGIGTNAPSTSLDIIRNGVEPFRVESTSGNRVSMRLANTGGNAFVEAINSNIVIPSGNVGIDSTAPARNLTIGGDTAATTHLQLTNATSGTTTGDGFHISQYTSGAVQLWNKENSYVSFGTNNDEAMRIDSTGSIIAKSGHIQIDGTTNTGPAGERWIGGNGTTTDLYLNAATGGQMILGVGNSNAAIIDSTGNVGIGTSAPVDQLDVKASGDDERLVRISHPSSPTAAAGYFGFTDTGLGANTGVALGVQYAGGYYDALTIDRETRNVGIGTTNPTAKMVVEVGNNEPASSGNMDTGMVVQSGNGSRAINMGGSNTGGYNWINSAYANNSSIAANLVLMTGAQERMRLDASGHLGIKTTPSPWRTTDGVIELGQRASLAGLSIDTHLSTNSYFSQTQGWKNIDTAVATNYYQNNGSHVWRSAPSVAAGASTPWVEHMRINSSGVLQVGATSQYSGALRAVFGVQSGGTVCEMHNSGGGAWTAIRFHTTSTLAGYISVATNTTAYNTSSDERLKENVVDAPAGNIDSIKVRSFDWKADGEHQEYGFIAQELETVAPYAVSKGETDEDMWAVDYSKLVPMMIKEIQDLKAEVAALKGA